MQISRIYSNTAEFFTPINFNFGQYANQLNVVLGEVRKPKDKTRDSHNLGKTTLLHLIDFMMLKGLSSSHFLEKHRERFRVFVFYVEIALNSGEFATIRCGVAEPTRIALTKHAEPGQDFSSLAEDKWDHPDLPIEEAIKLLDAWLDLRILQPYDYRKAITYFLRSQGDWGDELQLQKFQAGRDLFWKPFVAHLFGFKQGPIIRKYELDDHIQKLKQKQGEQQAEVQFKEDDIPKLDANLAIHRQQVETLGEQLDAFQFDAEERRLVRELVETVEQEISGLNQLIYDVTYDIREIENALKHKDKFDLSEVELIFKEASIYFPDQLKKDYNDLVGFKQKVTQERNKALRSRRKELDQKLKKAEGNYPRG